VALPVYACLIFSTCLFCKSLFSFIKSCSLDGKNQDAIPEQSDSFVGFVAYPSPHFGKNDAVNDATAKPDSAVMGQQKSPIAGASGAWGVRV
jgi:hypothetical protein